VFVDVARGWRTPQLLAQLGEKAEQLLAGCEAARDEPRSPLGCVPRAVVLDHGLRMHRGLGVGGELAHRRRPPQALGAGPELSEDLVVGVALPDPGLKLGELLRIDLGYRPEAALLGHANNGRAG
jgi:hypothetical protein